MRHKPTKRPNAGWRCFLLVGGAVPSTLLLNATCFLPPLWVVLFFLLLLLLLLWVVLPPSASLGGGAAVPPL